ncbi:Leucine rich repeat-containing protein [Butyrivibrio sp. ob235]|uniref:leucine-rich repeat domain-containing protein n=1 Tax=Butyrivibrio sp. ob235 TaxID=1761780 RepID=UPI0008CD53E7|nr:leucine-rich repeat domain-containing protein [Butyrivibrio sp. ob235]SEK25485.1 Leucine rich repeat-containing protein [Butyrivibrio sp. ob235]
MRMIKRISTITLTTTLILMLIPIQAFAQDTKDTFSGIPIMMLDGNGRTEQGKATVKMASSKYTRIDENQNEYEIRSNGGTTKDDLGPAGGNLPDGLDAGYSYWQIYRLELTQVISETMIHESMNNAATMTVPIPDGCSAAGAKRIYNCSQPDAVQELNKIDVTDNGDGTISFPIVLGFVDRSMGQQGTDFLVCGTYVVEYKKTIDISTLKTSASLSATSFDYTGAAITPDVTITGLTKDVDYTVAYTNNIEPGTATTTITGKGAYTGSFTLEFTINKKEYKQEEVKDEKTGASYEVTTNADGSVEATYMGSEKKDEKNVKIPDKITLPDGTEAKVTKVASGAFKNNKTVTSVTVGKNVTEIGSGAFQGCPKLKSVKIPASVTKIDKNAFKNCKNLKTITINAKNLKSVSKSAFKGLKKGSTIKITGVSGKKKTKAINMVKKAVSSGNTKVK